METYTCECCGQVRNDWPALTFKTPDTYYWLTDEEKANSTLTNDFCVVHTEGETYRFIRVVMLQKVIDSCQELHYGLWVSLSEASYNDYSENFKSENYKDAYFGWLNNNLPEYEGHSDMSIAMNVNTQKNGQRPYIVPHENGEHPLVADYYNGITIVEAEARVKSMIGQE